MDWIPRSFECDWVPLIFSSFEGLLSPENSSFLIIHPKQISIVGFWGFGVLGCYDQLCCPASPKLLLGLDLGLGCDKSFIQNRFLALCVVSMKQEVLCL